MELKLCEKCRGARVHMGMGMLEKKCEDCNGVGYVEKKNEPVEEVAALKRGRPAKE
jgi:DnaJ-class molecular chaperone